MRTIDEAVSANMLRLIHDTRSNGVPELHFRLWNRADDSTREAYLARLLSEPNFADWYAEGYLADDPDFDAMLAMPEDSLGYQYARHIVDNNLNKTIASDYRKSHEGLAADGRLDGMPDEARYAVVRGFQIHDIMHILTGYLTDGFGEIALQAFTLAQNPLPYSAIWMATLTAQMTYLHPEMTVGVMDAISQGWELGRRANSVIYTKWEEQLERSVADIQAEYGLTRPVHIAA